MAECVGPEGRVYAVDLSEKSIRELEKKEAGRSYHNIEVHASSAADLSFIKARAGDEKEGGLALLGTICIHPLHQRKGLGEALLNHVLEYCKQQKCHKITLNTFPVLVPAMNLYLKLGFVPEAYLRKEWWGVDFLKMSKWL